MTDKNRTEERKQRHGRRINDDGLRTLPDSIDTPHNQASGSVEWSSYRPRSKSVHERPTQDRLSRSHQPAVSPPGSSAVLDNGIGIPQTQDPAPERPSGSERRSRSHSRSQSHQVAYPLDPNAPPAQIVPLKWRSKKPAPLPSVVPPGYAEGTEWAAFSDGWPRLVAYDPHTDHYRTASPAFTLARQRHNSQAPIPHSQPQPIGDHARPQTVTPREDSSHLSSANSLNTTHRRRHSCSNSRPRLDQVEPPLDMNAPPVPPISPRSSRQQKTYPVPEVIPPGFPEDTRWVVGLGGRPRLETPDQFRARYGVLPPAVAPVRGRLEQPISPHPSLVVPSHSSFGQQSQLESAPSPVIVSPSPHKPFFKRIFRGRWKDT